MANETYSALTGGGPTVAVTPSVTVFRLAIVGAAEVDSTEAVSPARLLNALDHSMGCVLKTNSKCANARPASKPWHIFEINNQIRWVKHASWMLVVISCLKDQIRMEEIQLLKSN